MSDEKVDIKDDEKGLVLDHDYDGIKELNHPLPSWWVWTFVLTVLFSIPYFYYYHIAGGPTLVEEYEMELKEVEAAQARAAARIGGFKDESYKAFIAGGEALSMGKSIYSSRCAGCHGKQGQGSVGPNLADNFWLTGDGSPAEIYKLIDKGVPSKGMPAWGAMLSKDELMGITYLIQSWKGSNPSGAKAPQGNEYK